MELCRLRPKSGNRIPVFHWKIINSKRNRKFMSLIVVGTMAYDAIETPFGKTDKIVGGAALYAAYAASNFVKPINQVSIVGYDFAREEMDELKKRGVNLEGVEVKKEKKSYVWRVK